MKEDISDKYDIRLCPFHLHYKTRCLIEDHLITVYDIDIHRFNEMFTDIDENFDSALVERCFRYTRYYCLKNKESIYTIFNFFKAAYYENLRKMDGYDERMEKWYEEVDAYLKSVREDH